MTLVHRQAAPWGMPVPGGGTRRGQTGSRALRVAAAVLTVVLLGVVAGRWARQETDGLGSDVQDRPARTDLSPDAFFNVVGAPPSVFPATKLGLGFLALDEPLQEAVGVLGPVVSVDPDIAGQAHTWLLPSGARLTVSAGDGAGGINGLYASVPAGSPLRIGAYGGVVLGVSDLEDVVAAWGSAFTPATSPYDDYVVAYAECVGSDPVVIKFGQAAASGEDYAPTPGSPLWSEPVTSMLVAYADEPAGSGGCSLPML